MHYWVCVDDTDMPGTKGTGCLVQEICGELEEKGLGTCSAVSRHQLFVHEDIPFTSHNSAMSFEIDLPAGLNQSTLVDHMITALETRCEKGSDPGLCITGPLSGQAKEQLTAFGKLAKYQVCTKDSAYGLARDLGIHLSEHGGTGDGIIGAIAGLGLRMSGNDGRYRGWYHLGNPGDILNAGTLCDYPFIDRLVLESGSPLAPEIPVHIGSEKTKTIRIGHEQVVVVTDNEAFEDTGIAYRTITKKESKMY
ncbi:MAG: hypothetical protein MI863_10605 [Desulfobacterales bacterium]|nr:hypothetical protein [Desulfobacterales bacterium]